MEKLNFCKIRQVKSPNRAHEYDAGIDFYVPEDIPVETFLEKCKTTGYTPDFESQDGKILKIYIEPMGSALIPSGIKVNVPKGYMLQFNNKSGVASKKHLLVGASVVDTGYQGECHINIHNVGNEKQIISAGDKIVQGILIPISTAIPVELHSESELYNDTISERGNGGFGSSGN